MKTWMDLYKKIIIQLIKAETLIALLTRVVVGLVFVESGWGKIHNIEKVTDFFVHLNIPAPGLQAHFVAYSELIFGGMVLIGLLTRLASLPIIIIMIVAIITAKTEDIQGWTDIFSLSEFLYIALLLWIISKGPGKISIDHLFSQRSLSA